MKFIFTSIVASSLVASATAIGEGGTCYVIYNEKKKKYDDYDNGDGICDKSSQLECNYHIGDDGVTTDPILGQCEPKNCLGGNGNNMPAEGTHRVTICHRTCSKKNPWVRITIDDNAWADEVMCGHGTQHDIEADCKGVTDYTPWGGNTTDHLLYDHGTRADVRARHGFEVNSAEEKAYWSDWEPACPFVRNGKCCQGAECCGPTPAGGGGDPHFARWGQKHDTFHGECDLVLAQNEQFNSGAGLALHARTKIHSYYSYIETAALKVGENTMEFYNDHFFLNDVKFTPEDLPVTFMEGKSEYSITDIPSEQPGKHQNYAVNLNGVSSILFKFYKNFLTYKISGDASDFGGSVGLMGDFYTGEMVARDGKIMSNFEEFAFEWQVTPEDGMIFQQARAPQLPYERCRMPTAARPARRRLRQSGLFEQAQVACANAGNVDLCIDDVLSTEDLGLASLW